jgi:hypothetical protein
MPQIDIDEEVIYLDLVDEEVAVSTTKEITILENGTKIGTTRAIDFIPGANVTMDVAQAGSKISVTIASTGGGGGSGGHTIKGNGTAVTQRTGLNFSDKFTVSDDPGGDETDVTVNLTKSDVGLSNVDNTSDANKPVSTAQAAADSAVAAAAAAADTAVANAAAADATSKANAALASAIAADPVKASSAELQTGTNDTKFATALGLAAWWTWIKTQTQTLADLTATAFKIGGQAASSGTKNPLNIDDTGAVTKTSFIEIDTTNKKVTQNGSDDSDSTIIHQWKNLSGGVILTLYNGLKAVFGGTSALWTVPATIASGNAGFVFLSNLANALRFKDAASNDYAVVRSTTTDKAWIFKQKVCLDIGAGFEDQALQAKLTLPNTTAAANHIVVSIAVPAGSVVTVTVLKAVAVATNNSVVLCPPFSITARNVAGTTSGTTPTITPQYITATTGTHTAVANNTTDTIDLGFTNETGTGRQYDVRYTYIVDTTAIPV